MDHVGDFVHSTPLIRELRRNCPNSYITLVVSSPVYPLAQFCPYVNEVIPFDVTFSGVQNSFPHDVVETLNRIADFAMKHLWAKQYDLGICPQFFHWDSPLAPFMLYLSGAKRRVGFAVNAYLQDSVRRFPIENDVAHFLYTDAILPPKNIVHDVSRMLYLLQSIGMKIHSDHCELYYTKSDLFKAKNLLGDFAKDRIKVIAGIGASDKTRKYPIEKYLVALKEIISRGAAVIILGGPAERQDARFLEENLPAGTCKNLVKVGAGWRVDCAVMSLADVYVGNSTGMADIAAAAKLPTIVVHREAIEKESKFGKLTLSEYSTCFPYQTDAIVIRPQKFLDDCGAGISFGGCRVIDECHCIAQIKPSEIVAAFEEMMRFKYNSRIIFKTSEISSEMP